MKLAITICATKNYAYAMINQARRVLSAIQRYSDGAIILCGDDSQELLNVFEFYKSNLVNGWEARLIPLKNLDLGSNLKNYKCPAQILIATLRTYAFTEAQRLGADFCWSLDSDVLPQSNTLNCLMQGLGFDDGYYSISTSPYPSQGGGGFLGGRGTIYRPIEEDFTLEERKVPDGFLEKVQNKEKELKSIVPKGEAEFKRVQKLQSELQELNEEAKKYPPLGNVFALNAKKWRKRGWFDNAYPALGKGCILPSDWCGFGNTLLNKKALSLAYFDGYDGKGTEDLYIVWHRWYQHGLRINVIPHSPSDHVIRNPGYVEGKNAQYILQHSYSETEGECVGHLRYTSKPFYTFTDGERFDELNDGRLVPKIEDKPKESDNAIQKKDDFEEVIVKAKGLK